MGKKQSLLLSFIGTNDPFSKGEKVLAGGTPYGPIISAVNIGDFDTIILLTTSTPEMKDRAEKTADVIKELYPHKKVKIHHTNILDPTNHKEIINELNRFIQLEEDLLFKDDYDIYISITSGTPAIHACWILITASNKLPAKIIHVKEQRFTPSGKPAITQIDFTSSEFPKISPNITHEWREDDSPPTSFAKDYGLVGEADNFIESCQKAWKYAKSNHDVLLLGETGTGKELFAKMIHKVSGRTGKFVAINCGGFSKELLDSELFGHKKGAFTGAISDKIGLCKEAENGTLFLDEIGDTSPEVQIKLLRFIENKTYRPLGSNEEIEAKNVKFIFATNKDLTKAKNDGNFREDLYYRIYGHFVKIPPLRERISDIYLLTEYFILKMDNKDPKIKVPSETIKKLISHPWPGNVRELYKVIEKAVTLSQESRIIKPEYIEFSEDYDSNKKDYFKYLPRPYKGFSLEKLMDEMRDFYIEEALKIAGNNQSEAAKLLGITPQAISQYLKNKNLNSN